MRAVIQRVAKASVTVDGEIIGVIGCGLMILLGVKEGDNETDVGWLADKCVNLRIFENDEGKFDLSLVDVQGEALIVSQFTLYGDCRKGRRPSFTDAARPDQAEALYLSFVEAVRNKGLNVQTGRFAARMHVEIHNDGPVTLIIDSEGKS